MRKLGKLMFASLLVCVMLSLAACGQSAPKVISEEEQFTRSEVEYVAENYFQSIISMDEETVDYYIDEYEYKQDTVMANGLNSWKSSMKELGDFRRIKEATFDESAKEGTHKVVLLAEFSNRSCEFVLAMTDRELLNYEYAAYNGQQVAPVLTELTFNPVYTTGEKLSQAGINMLVGMGTVFAVLIFLTWIISLFKYVGKAQDKLEKKAGEKSAGSKPADAGGRAAAGSAAGAPAGSPAETANIAGTADEGEIQAVIAAAIAMYESEKECGIEKQPALNNGIVVRAYKRS